MASSKGHSQRRYDLNRDSVGGCNFNKWRGGFDIDITKGTAASKFEFDFWRVALLFDGATSANWVVIKCN